MTKDKSQDRDRPGSDPAGPAQPQGSLGSWLRGQREARGVSLRDIADASKISLRYLEALELDRFEVLPAPIFTRGFLREYARVVGLDPDEVVNLFLLAAGSPTADVPPTPAVTRSRSGRAGAGPSSLGYGLLLGLAVVIFLAIAALLSLWASRRSRTPDPGPRGGAPTAVAPTAPPPPVALAQAPAAEPVAARAQPTARPLDSEPDRRATPAAAPLTAAPQAPSPGPAAEPSGASRPEPPAANASEPVVEPLRLSLEFSQDSWVELVVDGQRRSGELRTAGEVVAIEARDFVLLTLGNSPGVRVEVDGRPFALPESSLRVVRDLRIDRATVAGPPPTLRP